MAEVKHKFNPTPKPITKNRGNYVLRIYIDGKRKELVLCKVDVGDYKMTKRGKRLRTEKEKETFLLNLATEKEKKSREKSEKKKVEKDQGKKIVECFQEWLNSGARYWDQRTVVSYANSADYWIAANGDYLINQTSHKHQDKFMDFLEEKKLRPSSKQTHIRQLQLGFNWCHENGYLFKELKLKQYSTDKHDIQSFTTEHLGMIERRIRHLIKDGPSRKRWIYFVHLRMHYMLMESGMRAGECLNLKLSDIDIENRLITVTTTPKGGKYKTRRDKIDMSESLARFLEFEDKPTRGDKDEWYLDDGTGYQLYTHRDQMSRCFKRYLDKLGIKGIKPLHGYRASLATRLLQNGTDLVTVQKIMRHEQLETTRLYITSELLDPKKALDALPRQPLIEVYNSDQNHDKTVTEKKQISGS